MMRVGTNILIHPDTTGPGKFARRLQEALINYDIDLLPGPVGSIFLASSILEPHEYAFVNQMKILHRVDNTGELYPWDGTQWTTDTKNVQYVYERADAHIFQTQWSVNQFKKCPNLYSLPKNYTIAFNGVPLRPIDDRPKGTGILCSICNTWNMTRLYGYIKYFLPNLHQIFAEVPDFRWMVVGKIELLLKELSKYDLSKYIGSRILPVCFPADLNHIRNISDGFIHLLYNDSCPNSVVESIMYSLPGITLNTGAAELIGEGGFYFNEPTVIQLINSIKSILDENKKRRTLTYQYASKYLDINVVSKQYANAIYKLA